MKRLLILFVFLVMSSCTTKGDNVQSLVAESSTSTAVFLPIVTRSPEPLSIPTAITKIDLPLQPGEILTNPQTGEIYILAGGTHIAVISGTELTTLIPLPGTNAKTFVTDNDNKVFVAHDCEGQGCITIIQNNKIASSLKTSLDQIEDIAINPDTHLLYAVGMQKNGDAYSARLVSTNGTEILETIDLGNIAPNKVVVDLVYDHIYVGGLKLDTENSYSMLGTLITIYDHKISAELILGQAIVDIVANSETGDTYVLQIPDYEGNKKLEDITLLRNGAIITEVQTTHTSPADYLKINPITGDIFIVNLGSQTVATLRNIDERLESSGQVLVGSGAAKMTVDTHTGNIYFANFNDDTVSVFNGFQSIATVDVGWYPYGIGVNTQNGWVYVSNTNERTVTVLGYDEQ